MPFQFVNNSGYPDEAVYVTSYGQPGDGSAPPPFYYDGFCSPPLAVVFPASSNTNAVGTQYSYPLTALPNVDGNGRPLPPHTYQYNSPGGVWGVSDDYNFSLGVPLTVGMNSSTGLETPGIALNAVVSFGLFEVATNGGGAPTYDVSFVDQFSVPIEVNAVVQGASDPNTAIGFGAGGRDDVLEEIYASSAYSICAQRTGFRTVTVLSPGQILSQTTSAALAASLNAGINSGWSTWGGNNNAAIDWWYGTFNYLPASDPNDPNSTAINLTVNEYIPASDFPTPSATYVLSFPKPDTSDPNNPTQPGQEIFEGLPPYNVIAGTPGPGAANIQAIIAACLQRGVFSTYADWGTHGTNPTNPDNTNDLPLPQDYYVTSPYNVYASIIHANSLRNLGYAFSSDDHYDTSGTTAYTNTNGTVLQVIIQPFDRAK